MRTGADARGALAEAISRISCDFSPASDVSSSRRAYGEREAEDRSVCASGVIFPLTFTFRRIRGRPDVFFEVAAGTFGDARATRGRKRRASDAPGGLDCVIDTVGDWLVSPDARAIVATMCLQIAFPETTRRVATAGAALALARETLRRSESEPRSLGVMDKNGVVVMTRAALVTRAFATTTRFLVPTAHAWTTAATALLSVKLLFKQPPLRAGLARAMHGTRGVMTSDERIGLWHTRYRWAALRLAKHIPSDPVRTIDDAPLAGLLVLIEGLAMRMGGLNLVEDGNAREGSFSMSLPASWRAAKRARRLTALGSKRAIEAEGKLHPVDVLDLVRASMRDSFDGIRRPDLMNIAVNDNVRGGSTRDEGSRSREIVHLRAGADVVAHPEREELVGDSEGGETNIWRDTQLSSASWATDGLSAALMLRATYLFITWLPVLTVAIPLLMLSKASPGPLSAVMRKRAWSTLHTAIALCGAAFIKWAQWASTREDVFPKDLCEQFEQLHDDAPKHSYRQTYRILSRELGCDPRLIFVQFSKTPMASGSVAQVYKARLRREVAAVCSELAKPRRLTLNQDGTMDVAVKVRHPNVAKRIFLDFQILRAVAGFADSLTALKGMHLKNTLGQFSHTMTSQTDLRNEADHLLKFTHNMKREVQVVAPRPVPGLATEAVLVETFMQGDGLGNAIKRKTSRNSELCSLGVHTYMLMLLRDNFIHQDLHPGNILYSVHDPSNARKKPSVDAQGVTKLELIDFGIADELPQTVRNKFIGFLCFLLRGEGEKAADVALTWDTKQTCTNVVALRRDMAHLVSIKGDIYKRRVDLDELLKEIMQLFRKHSVSIDGIYASLVVSLCVLVGFATSLDPEINLFEVAAPSVMAFALTGNVVGRLFES